MLFSIIFSLIYVSLVKSSSPIIRVNTTSVKHLDYVLIQFSGLPINDTSIWIGVFYPSSANVSTIPPLTDPYSSAPWTATPPLKWILCKNIPSAEEFLLTGAGSFVFRLENTMTLDAKFSIFSGDITTPKLLVESTAVLFTDTGVNLHGHLARTQDPSEMIVRFYKELLEI